MPRNIVTNPRKGRMLILGAIGLVLVLAGAWYYLNQTNYLGSKDSSAAFLPGTCNQAKTCGKDQVAVCRPVKCVCNPSTGGVMGTTKDINRNGKVIKGESVVCVNKVDKKVRCKTPTTPKPTAQVQALEKEIDGLNTLKDSMTAYANVLRAKGKAIKGSDVMVLRSLDSGLSSIQASITEKSKQLGMYRRPTSGNTTCYYTDTTELNDNTSCKTYCAQYKNYMDGGVKK